MAGPVLRQLRHPLWSPQSPKGFGDTTVEWADSGLAAEPRRVRAHGRRCTTRRHNAADAGERAYPAAEPGPNVAAVEFSGWDTRANQGLAGGALDRLLGQLADGLVAFRTEMGDAWSDTTVVVMTEFGRTARPNGTRGTEHGTAGAAS